MTVPYGLSAADGALPFEEAAARALEELPPRPAAPQHAARILCLTPPAV